MSLDKISGLARRFASQNYYTADCWNYATGADGTRPAGTIFFSAFTVGQMTTFDLMRLRLVTGQANGTVSLGIYADDGYGRPGALIYDSDPITATSAENGTDAVTVNMNVTLAPGLYWIASLSRGSSSISTNCFAAAAFGNPFGSRGDATTAPVVASATNLAGYAGYSEAGHTADTALPAVATPALNGTAAHLVYIRAL